MKFTRITFNTVDKKTKKIGKTMCMVFDAKAVYRFDNVQQADITFKKMRADGKKVLFSRGMIYQFFPNKTRKQLVKMLKEDAYKGAENTKSGKAEIVIENWKEVQEER